MPVILTALALVRRLEMMLAMLLLALVSAVVLAGTIGRYGGFPLIWSDEVAQALFVWLVFLAADLTLQRAGHFRLDVVVSRLPHALRYLIEAMNYLIIIALLCMLIFYAWRLTGIASMRPLPITRVPSSFVIAALPVGFALMAITLVEHMIGHLRGRPVVADARATDVT
jgi:TRAP-type C4-dicarboxylate transport system permease small subunit